MPRRSAAPSAVAAPTRAPARLARIVRNAFVGVLLLVGASAPARAAEPGDDALVGARAIARDELTRLVEASAPEARARLVGVYVAFDPSATDLVAAAACDDDGDPVVVLSDAMLRLAEAVARARAFDEANGSSRVEDYATWLAERQLPGARLLPPPAGTYTGGAAPRGEASRLREVQAGLLARELAHLVAGDVVCRGADDLRERGDAEWTEGERRTARELAPRVYAPSRNVPREEAAARLLVAAERTEQGYLALLRFFARIEATRLARPGRVRFSSSYEATHPDASLRLAAVRAASDDARARTRR